MASHWGPPSWGHVVSDDLVTWRRRPLALEPRPDGPDAAGCWSGCARILDGRPTIFYTAVRDGVESVCRAFGDATLECLEPDPASPVIAGPPPGGVPQHRDPFLWREDGRWRLILGTSAESHGRLLHYDSPDGADWTYRGIFCEGPRDSGGFDLGTVWECPQLVDERVLIVSCALPDGCDPLWYCAAFVGDIDSDARFDGRFVGRLDHGDAYYAAMVSEDGGSRRLVWAWAPERLPDATRDRLTRAGALTLPRVLRTDGDRVLAGPAPELVELRRAALAPERAPGAQLELCANVAGDSGSAGWTLHDGAGAVGARIVVDLDRRALTVTARRPGAPDAVSAAPLTGGGPYALRAFVDGSLLEVFVDDGAPALTTRAYAAWSGAHAVREGAARVTNARAWTLSPDAISA